MTIDPESGFRTKHTASAKFVLGNQDRIDAAVQFFHKEFEGVVGGFNVDNYEGLQNVVIGAGDVSSDTFFAGNPFALREKSASSADRFRDGRFSLGRENMNRKEGYLYLETSKNSTKGRGTVSLVLVNKGGKMSYPRYPAGHAKQGQRISLSTNDPEFNKFAENFTTKRNSFNDVVGRMNAEDVSGATLQKGFDLFKDNQEAQEVLDNLNTIVRSVEETNVDVQKLRAAIFDLENGEISESEYQERQTAIIGANETVYGLSVLEKANKTVIKTNNDKSQVLTGALIQGLVRDAGEYGGIKLAEAKAIIMSAPFVKNKLELISEIEQRADEVEVQSSISSLSIAPLMPSSSMSSPSYDYPYQDTDVKGANSINSMASFQQILASGRIETYIASTVDSMFETLSATQNDVLKVDKADLRSVAVAQAKALYRQATVTKRLEAQNNSSLRAVLTKKDQDALKLKIDTERAQQALTFKTNRQKAMSKKALEFIAKQVKGGKVSGVDFAEFKANAKPFYTAMWGSAFFTEDDIPDYFFVELEKLMKDK